MEGSGIIKKANIETKREEKIQIAAVPGLPGNYRAAGLKQKTQLRHRLAERAKSEHWTANHLDISTARQVPDATGTRQRIRHGRNARKKSEIAAVRRTNRARMRNGGKTLLFCNLLVFNKQPLKTDFLKSPWPVACIRNS